MRSASKGGLRAVGVKIALSGTPLDRIFRGLPSEESKAEIAQLVEQLAFNQLVLGSSPSLRTCLQDGEAGFLPQPALA